MRLLNTTRLVAPLAVLFLVSCSNPADNVPAASVREASVTRETSEAVGTLYAFTEDSTITFIGSKVTGSHDGGFHVFEGSFTLQDEEIESARGEIVIDMNSTWSDNNRLTDHLKNEDFFHVEQFPTSRFELFQVESGPEGYILTGNLTLHGVTKEISFPATIESVGNGFTLSAEFFILRFDFDIVYPGRADDLIRDEVVIKLDLHAVPIG